MGNMKKTRKKDAREAEEIKEIINGISDAPVFHGKGLHITQEVSSDSEESEIEEPSIDLIQQELDRYISGITETDEGKRKNIISNLNQYYNALRKMKE